MMQSSHLTPNPSDTPLSVEDTSIKITTAVGDVIVTKAEIVSKNTFGSAAAPG